MKIMCQEYFDAVVRYAESIGDCTLQESLDRLERWGQNARQAQYSEEQLSSQWNMGRKRIRNLLATLTDTGLIDTRRCAREASHRLGIQKKSGMKRK